ncbi:MAG TPA: acyltransferase [Terriglobales bacterium]
MSPRPLSASATLPLLRPYMPELDIARGIAIVLVLLYHGVAPPRYATLSPAGQLFFRLSQHGWVGVNLFFVLSGFLITGILIDSNHRTDYFRHFYIRRALRILPALVVTLLLLRAVGWISWSFFGIAALFLANCVSLFGIALQYPPLWSLAVEEHFYLIWPGMLRRFSPRTLAIPLLLIAILTPVARSWGFALSGHKSDYVPLYTWFNLDGLALGALMAIWLRQTSFRRTHLKRLGWLMLVAGSTGFALAAAHRGAAIALSATAANIASGGLLGCMLLLGTSRWSWLVARPALKFMGYISYGVYLIHVFAFRVAELVLSNLSWISPIHPEIGMSLRLITGVTIAIALAYISRITLEEKFLRMGHRAGAVSAVRVSVAQP